MQSLQAMYSLPQNSILYLTDRSSFLQAVYSSQGRFSRLQAVYIYIFLQAVYSLRRILLFKKCLLFTLLPPFSRATYSFKPYIPIRRPYTPSRKTASFIWHICRLYTPFQRRVTFHTSPFLAKLWTNMLFLLTDRIFPFAGLTFSRRTASSVWQTKIPFCRPYTTFQKLLTLFVLPLYH